MAQKFHFYDEKIISKNHFCDSDDWMMVPNGIPECPRGLEYLTTLNQLLLQQKTHLAEALLGFEQNNKYVIKNCLGQNVSGFLSRISLKFQKIQFYSFICSCLHKIRCIWPLKTRIVALETVVAIIGHLTWKYWICIAMKLSIFIVLCVVLAAGFHVACNPSKYHHHLAKWLDALMKNGLVGFRILRLKTKMVKLYYGSKVHAAHFHAARISILR